MPLQFGFKRTHDLNFLLLSLQIVCESNEMKQLLSGLFSAVYLCMIDYVERNTSDEHVLAIND